ncbi:MAG: hypothetical protein IAG13_25940 [Deltaproteobacteria bacterium]|nr:hypothetical protein [Nannocystaceae bacterium]
MPAPVQAVFDARCATTPSCHASGSPNVSLAAGESAAIIGQTSSTSPSALPLVELGNAEGSYLVQKMNAMPPKGDRMPVGADFEDPQLQADLALVVGWVAGSEFSGCAAGSETTSGSESTADTTASTSMGDSGEEPEFLGCGLDPLAPGAESPIVAGDGVDQIPTEIGFLLANSCGCHYSEGPFARNVPAYSGTIEMATLDDWRALVPPARTQTLLQLAATRVADESPGGMPPPLAPCDIGTGDAMPPAERARLLQWMMADGPDGTSWPP